MENDTSITEADNIIMPRLMIISSVIVAVLVTVTSLAGILLEGTYSEESFDWASQAMAQDYANLIVVALLLIATYLVYHHSFKGYLLWIGAYIYLVYAYMIYSFALHFNALFLAYVVILGLSFYTMVGGLLVAEKEKISVLFTGGAQAKTVSIFLMAVGILFYLMWLLEIISSILDGTIPRSVTDSQLPVNPVHVLDLAFLLPAMIITAVFLWRRILIGYLMAVPLLVFTATMGLAILFSFALSANSGIAYSLPAAAIVAIIVIFSVYFAYAFLREVGYERTDVLEEQA